MWVFLVNLIFFSLPLQKKQREFEEYIRDKYITAKADFRTLLKETKFITYRYVQSGVPLAAVSPSLYSDGQSILFTHTHVDIVSCRSEDASSPRGRHRLYHSTFLILFCFFKERAQMSILILCYLHPVFKYTFIFASLLLFTFLRTLNSLRIIIHEETWNESFPMNYLCLLWGLLSVVRLSMPEIILLRQKNHFFPSWEINLLDTFIF